MERLKVLLSTFACRPGEGSELGVGWNMARELSSRHEVWVLTQGRHRPAIEAEITHNPIPRLRFVYYDLPHSVGWRQRRKTMRGLPRNPDLLARMREASRNRVDVHFERRKKTALISRIYEEVSFS